MSNRHKSPSDIRRAEFRVRQHVTGYVRRFLNFIDQVTEYGRKDMPSTEILRLFAIANGMTEEQVSILRNQLEAKGIL